MAMDLNDQKMKNKMVIGDERGSQALWNAKTKYIIEPAYTSGERKIIEERLQRHLMRLHFFSTLIFN